MKTSKVLLAAILLFTPVLLAQQTATPNQPMQMPMHMDCEAMMQKMQSMHVSQKAMDDRLATLVDDMNKARGSAKVDRMAAVINELVTQRAQMRNEMEKMMPQMMSHMMQHMQSGMTSGMQSMANCPMMSSSTKGETAPEHKH